MKTKYYYIDGTPMEPEPLLAEDIETSIDINWIDRFLPITIQFLILAALISIGCSTTAIEPTETWQHENPVFSTYADFTIDIADCKSNWIPKYEPYERSHIRPETVTKLSYNYEQTVRDLAADRPSRTRLRQRAVNFCMISKGWSPVR